MFRGRLWDRAGPRHWPAQPSLPEPCSRPSGFSSPPFLPAAPLLFSSPPLCSSPLLLQAALEEQILSLFTWVSRPLPWSRRASGSRFYLYLRGSRAPCLGAGGFRGADSILIYVGLAPPALVQAGLGEQILSLFLWVSRLLPWCRRASGSRFYHYLRGSRARGLGAGGPGGADSILIYVGLAPPASVQADWRRLPQVEILTIENTQVILRSHGRVAESIRCNCRPLLFVFW